MATQATPALHKRLIVCCDGTWMNSDSGYVKPTLWNPVGELQTPSNATRMSRSLRRNCSDGTIQIINYQSGVGTGSTMSDIISGGAFGTGIAEHIREAYSFVCANYVDGDEIVLVGFSRGAFTARSVAGMIGNLGLLTRTGMDYFYPIFKDMENWRTPNYKDPFPNLPFPNKPRGEDAGRPYRQMLIERGYTRVYQNDNTGDLIRIKAVAVWETVGSLGIPNLGWLSKIILPSTKEYRFYNTDLSDRIEYAFQALAMDEHRPPFSPAVWERTAKNRHTTQLRQIWFPGNHGNVGGGWPDQGIANMSLAWMMDQMASIGIEFDEGTIPRIFDSLERYYRNRSGQKRTLVRHLPHNVIANESDPEDSAEYSDGNHSGNNPAGRRRCGAAHTKHWAIEPIYQNNAPIRPWGLGELLKASGLLYKLTGNITRTPGMYKKVNPWTGDTTSAWLEDTNERIHSSVRVRLAVGGLGLDDKNVWDCPALSSNWRLRKTTKHFEDPIPRSVRTWGLGDQQDATEENSRPQTGKTSHDQANGSLAPSTGTDDGERWIWEYIGPESNAPPQRILVEEPLGPYERQLLRLAAGNPNVYDFAESLEARS